MVCIVPMWYIDKFYKQLFITPTMADNKTKTPLKRRTRRTKKQMQEDKEKASALLPMESLFNINAVDNLALLPHLPLTHYLNVPCSAGELPLPFPHVQQYLTHQELLPTQKQPHTPVQKSMGRFHLEVNFYCSF